MSAKTDKIAELIGVAKDAERTVSERLAALNEANEVRKDVKLAWAKLGVPDADKLRENLEKAVTAEADKMLGECDDETSLPDGGGTVLIIGSGDEGFDTDENAGRLHKLLVTKVADVLRGDPELTVQAIADLVSETTDAVNEVLDEAIDEAAKPKEDAPTEPVAEEAKKPARKAKEKAPIDPNRGAITKMVNELLMVPAMSYQDIVDAVVAAHPEAKTTTRSVASVAADLRKAKGIDVPTRRVAAAPKPKKEPTAPATDTSPGAPGVKPDEPAKDPLDA
jgi:hypothetical protein